MQYLWHCIGSKSFNISHGLNLMLRKLTCHMSKLAIRVLQFLAFLFSFQFSLQQLSFSALLLTLTMPLAKPLLRLAAFDKRRLSLIGLPQNLQISFPLYHPHSALSSSKSSGWCQFQRLVVCLR